MFIYTPGQGIYKLFKVNVSRANGSMPSTNIWLWNWVFKKVENTLCLQKCLHVMEIFESIQCKWCCLWLATKSEHERGETDQLDSSRSRTLRLLQHSSRAAIKNTQRCYIWSFILYYKNSEIESILWKLHPRTKLLTWNPEHNQWKNNVLLYPWLQNLFQVLFFWECRSPSRAYDYGPFTEVGWWPFCILANLLEIFGWEEFCALGHVTIFHHSSWMIFNRRVFLSALFRKNVTNQLGIIWV